VQRQSQTPNGLGDPRLESEASMQRGL